MIIRGRKNFKGEYKIPGDKSISHRALIFSSLGHGTTIIRNILYSDDLLMTMSCLEDLGVEIEKLDDSSLKVHGQGLDGLRKPSGPLYCGNSGTSMRLLTGLLAGQDFDSVLLGDDSLNSRPMDRVRIPLELMGARIETASHGGAPIRIEGGARLKGIDYDMPVASAQVKSAIILASLYADGESRIGEPSLSRNHTELMLDYFREEDFRPEEIFVPGDLSSAAFFMVGALISEGSHIIMREIGINPSRTGIIDCLQEMGGDIKIFNIRERNKELYADIEVRHSQLRGIDISGDMIPRLIDELPILAVAAAFAQGRTRVSDAEELRVKETDRIHALVEGFREFGLDIEERKDGFIIEGPVSPRPGRVDSYLDHRIAMAFSIMALAIEGESEIISADSVAVSFPNFYKLLDFSPFL